MSRPRFAARWMSKTSRSGSPMVRVVDLPVRCDIEDSTARAACRFTTHPVENSGNPSSTTDVALLQGAG